MQSMIMDMDTLKRYKPKPTTCRMFQACLTTIFIAILSSSLSRPADAFMIHIDAGVENECYHEKVPIGTKLGFSFEVIEGGFYDIDVEIKDPANVILHQDERSSNGKFTIEATMDGAYQFCFSNKKSSYTPKIILFDIDKSEKKSATPGADGTKEGEETVKLSARDKVHRKVNETTNSTIVWWSGVEFLLLLSVTLGQVWYLKRFFEIRRKA